MGAPSSRSHLPFVAAIVVASACTPFEGGESVPSAEGGAPDAAASGVDADAPTPDGGPSASFCAGHPGATVCDAFDGPSPFAPEWNREGVIDGGKGRGAFEGAQARSAPRAFVTRLPAGCTNAYAQLVHSAPVFPAKMVVAATIFVASMPTATNVHLYGTETTSSKGHFRVDLAFAQDRLVLVVNDAGSTKTYAANAVLSVGAFARVEMELSFSGGARAVVRVDGATRIDESVTIPELTIASARFELGNYAESGCDKPVETWFDDVVYTLTPR